MVWPPGGSRRPPPEPRYLRPIEAVGVHCDPAVARTHHRVPFSGGREVRTTPHDVADAAILQQLASRSVEGEEDEPATAGAPVRSRPFHDLPADQGRPHALPRNGHK